MATSDFSPDSVGVPDLNDVDESFSLDTTSPSLVKDNPQFDSFDVTNDMAIGDADLTNNQDTKNKRKSATPASDVTASKATPAYDPATLLNPKAAKRPRIDNDVNDEEPAQQIENGGSRNGIGSMIERMHDVQHRDGQLGSLKRKPKPTSNEEDESKEDDGLSAKFSGMKSGGDLAQYVKDKRIEGQKEAIASGSSIVDLTAEEDDDDLQILSETKNVEICLGRIEGAFVNAEVVPHPRGTFTGSSSQWPMIHIALVTAMGDHPFMIRARDGQGKRFGRVEAKTSGWLAPIVRPTSLMKVRPVARIESRKKKPNENPGQATSDVLSITLHVYTKRQHADAIGRYLSQKGIRLRRPTFVEKGREIYNPHEPTRTSHALPGAVGFSGNSVGTTTTVQRTFEEVRDEVAGVFDKLTKDEDMPQKDAPSTILTPLLNHQKQALWFMTDRERLRNINDDDSDSVSLWRRKIGRNGKVSWYSVITSHEYAEPPVLSRGGILADVMGLGKTLDILSLIMDSRTEASQFAEQAAPDELICNVKGTLLVCPMSTTANWEEQIRQHIRKDEIKVYIYHGNTRTSDAEKLADYDIVITTFGTLAADFKRTNSKPLHEVNWFRVVLDEAHQIRTQNTGQNLAACALAAERRWSVTGTPIQNRLEDLGALIKFLRVAPIDDKGRFQQFVLTPFKNGDASVVHKLQLLVNSITIRRLKDRIDLPDRKDHYVRLDFNKDEQKVYEFFAKDGAARVAAATAGHQQKLGGKAYIHVLRAILRLRQICAHGQDLLNDEDHKMMEGMDAEKAITIDDEDDEVDENERQVGMHAHQAYEGYRLVRDTDNDYCASCSSKLVNPELRGNDSSGSSSEEEVENTLGYMAPCYQIICPKCFPRYEEFVKASQKEGERLVSCPLCSTAIRPSFFKLTAEGLRRDKEGRSRVKEDDKLSRMLARYTGPSTKVVALLEDLEKNRQESMQLPPGEPPIKSVVFSGWTSNLDLVEIALRRENVTFNRLDGTMTRTKRVAALNAFSTDPSVIVMLVSISAGGLGLNLTAASKVYVLDIQYNPAAEAQAVDRVHRLGQKRDVDITRFIIRDSFEESMIKLQDKKRNLAKMVTGRKLSREEEIKEKLDELRSLFR